MQSVPTQENASSVWPVAQLADGSLTRLDCVERLRRHINAFNDYVCDAGHARVTDEEWTDFVNRLDVEVVHLFNLIHPEGQP